MLFALAAASAQAGGPLVVCANAPTRYPGNDIYLNYDLGDLGGRTKAQADAIVAAAVSIWADVPTSSVRILRGADMAVDVTAANYLDYVDNYTDGLNPVIYDTDGSIIDALLGAGSKDSVLGIARSTYYGPPTCQFVEGHVILNGYLAAGDGELRAKVAHEVGHLMGLDHAQLGAAQGLAPANYPLMHPLEERGDATLHEDDAAAVSALYPSFGWEATYGELGGTFVLADGVTPVKGANLWARETTTNKVYSIVSDYLMLGTGYFRLLLPYGTYNFHAEAILPGFTGELSVGPYAEASDNLSFQAPLYVGGNPMATVTLGNGTPTAFDMNADCDATLVFRIDGTGTVEGDCAGTAPPDAPVIGTATAGPGSISVTFTPTDLHGAMLIHHRVSCAPELGSGTIATGAASPIVVTGLIGGINYRCWAQTQTPRGVSPWSAASNWATPTDANVPAVPAITGHVEGPGQTSISFTPGSLNGGTLVHHHARCTRWGGIVSEAFGTGSPIVVTGLTGWYYYGCQVRTVSNLGTGAWSTSINVIAPPFVSPPAAPVIGTATAGPARVSVGFTPGSLNNGTLVHHEASCRPAVSGPNVYGYGIASPIVVTGVTSGIAYRCSVRTLNEAGYGYWSSLSNAVTPTDGPPAQPVMGSAVAGPGEVTVHFTPGSLNGGTLVHHHATCTTSTGSSARDGYGAASPIVVSGLTMDIPYHCWVQTVNSYGPGAWSVASNYATPTAGPPVAPTMGTATPGSLQLSVSFTPGLINGGSLIHHHVTCAAATGPSFNGYGATSPIVVSGLSSEMPYRCWARTISTLGQGAWSRASNGATPGNGPPAVPVAVTATAGPAQISVAFTPGSLNGGTLTHHHATCYAGFGPAYNAYGAASPLVVTGTPSGTPHHCWVRTVTSLGTSTWSKASNWVTPADGPPSAPVMGTATAGSLQVSVAFTPGSLNGGILVHHHVTCATATAAFNAYSIASPIAVTGLASGTAYRCWARTVTSLGTGPWSGASNWETPAP